MVLPVVPRLGDLILTMSDVDQLAAVEANAHRGMGVTGVEELG